MKPEGPSTKALAIVWLVLIALHFTILGLSLLNLAGFGTPLIMMLAMVQMILVMLIFMELRASSKLIKVFASAGFFWLLIQFTLVASDYLTRAFH